MNYDTMKRSELVALIKKNDAIHVEHENRFEDVAMLLPGIICEWDATLKLRYVNKKGMDTFLFTKEQFARGIYLFDLISQADHAKAKKDMYNIFHGDFGNAAVYSVKRSDGATLHLLVNGAPIFPEGGIRMCVVDITARVEAEDKLRESETRLKSIISWSPIGIALCDTAGMVIESNAAFLALFDLPHEANGAGFPVFARSAIPRDKHVLIDKGESVEYESAMQASASASHKVMKRFLLWHCTPLRKNNGGMQLLLMQVQDITGKKTAEENRLKNMRQETENALHTIANLKKEMLNRSSFQNMVSRSPLMKDIFTILPQVASSPATVLVTGKSGSGKELVALSLHDLSDRKDKPFVTINCSALPDTLLESELFGYKEGAFTDAKKDKLGTFARAHEGTVFLDEIGDISPAMQVKLLRVIQEKTFEPLGATEPVQVDVRIIAATNRDLAAMVKTGEFREDLYYRINVLVIKLPALSDRRCDIPLLCDYFIARFNARYNKSIQGVSMKAENVLLSYDFPGNIRELENILEHAFVFCQDSMIELSHLPQRFHEYRNLHTISGSDFASVEKAYLESVLVETGGSKIRAAKKLGIHKATLFRKIKKLHVDPAAGQSKEQKPGTETLIFRPKQETVLQYDSVS